jgi:hypothetical protein
VFYATNHGHLGVRRAQVPIRGCIAHSIVSSTRKHLKTGNFVSGRANITVRSTDKKCCLGTIAADRRRKVEPDPALLLP